MAETAIDIRELSDGVWQLDFTFNQDFIDFLKSRVPPQHRSYDPETNFWQVRSSQYLPALEGIAAQKFTFATRIFRRGSETVWRNLVTGNESVQKSLFETCENS